jgi:GNAT superfamily N-acetyltransferase
MTEMRVNARRRGLGVKQFAVWNDTLSAALTELPELESCPHELLMALMQLPSPGQRKIFLISDGSAPVAIVPLDYEGGYWKPGLLPPTLTIGPAKDGAILGALEATRLPIRIGYWAGELPEDEPNLCETVETPTYRMPLGADLDQYWRSARRIHGLNQARNRCKDFEFEVNGPGAVAWTITRWAEKWADASSPAILMTSARLLTGEYLQPLGRHHTFRLFDGSRAVAGLSGVARGGELMLLCNYRDPEYDWHGVGNRCMELAFRWAASEGLAVGLGGGFGYKEGWAPQDGSYHEFSILPRRVQIARELERRARRAARPVRRFVRGRRYRPGARGAPEPPRAPGV